VPRVALPNRVALLAYLGVDLIDSTEALWKAEEGVYLDATFGSMPAASARRFGRCPCPACRSEPAGSLGEHAVACLTEELALVRSAIVAQRLRELVETRLPSEPLLAVVLRYADRLLGEMLESRAPVVGDEIHGYVVAESFRRPEMVRFRQRFLERYRPPTSKRVLLLVPCSKTKPYRRSRSHRRFAGALEGVAKLGRVHLVSVTSPLGLVPRELEDVYPARHYDIPVTGEWSEAEREAVRQALRHLGDRGGYSRIIAHLDPEEYGFLSPELSGDPPVSWTVEDGRPTSNESLARLRTTVETVLEEQPGLEGGPLGVVREELRAIAEFQFGRDGAAALWAGPIRLVGRPWFQRITDPQGKDLATWQEQRGLFQLTVAGGQRLMASGRLQVEVDPNVDLKGDLFGPGVVTANPEIRTGDAVLLVRAGGLLGVGEARLPGPLMADRPRGCAVHVRHRVGLPPRSAPVTDTDLTEESSRDPGPVV
jgi:archaeosine synthase alpha-subunit